MLYRTIIYVKGWTSTRATRGLRRFSRLDITNYYQVFRAVNTLCLKYYNQSQSSRALEMIVQAYWIECYEARIAVLRLENPNLSAMEIRMMGLREACAVLNWKEKDLRNRMYAIYLLQL